MVSSQQRCSLTVGRCWLPLPCLAGNRQGSVLQKLSYRVLAGRALESDVTVLNCCCILQDQVELEVIPLKAVRIHVPSTRLITGTEVL